MQNSLEFDGTLIKFLVLYRHRNDSGVSAAATPYGARSLIMSNLVDVSRGEMNSSLSGQWRDRPSDERFLSLVDLRSAVAGRKAASGSRVMPLRELTAVATDTGLKIDSGRGVVTPTNWAFSQLASRADAIPASSLRKLSEPLAAACLNEALQASGVEAMAYVEGINGAGNFDNTLRAMTSSSYGRIYDLDVVDVVQRLDGDWTVPGVMDWGSMRYDSDATVNTENTTLYASDRDCWMFLVDHTRPIQVGTLPGGEPDLLYRGFMVWNSEVGSASLGCATLYFRSVCGNRCIWGVEEYFETRIIHRSGAPERLYTEFRPMLEKFVNASPAAAMDFVTSAQASKLVVTHVKGKTAIEGAAAGKIRSNFNQAEIKRAVEKSFDEESKPVENVWDFVNGLTAYARSLNHQDARVSLERRAGSLVSAS